MSSKYSISSSDSNHKETICRGKRIEFVQKLKSHMEIIKQRIDGAEELFDLSTRLGILENARCPPVYPQKVIDDVIDEILQKKNRIIKCMNVFIDKWSTSYIELRQKLREFHVSAELIDWQDQTPLLIGCAREKPLKYYLDTSLDILIYYAAYHKHVYLEFQKIILTNFKTIDNFTEAMNLNEKFVDLLAQFNLNCRCFMSTVKDKDSMN